MSRLIANYITFAVGEVLLLILTLCSLAAIFPRVSATHFTHVCEKASCWCGFYLLVVELELGVSQVMGPGCLRPNQDRNQPGGGNSDGLTRGAGHYRLVPSHISIVHAADQAEGLVGSELQALWSLSIK